MKANPNRFWFLVILLGWSFDFLFWDKPAGINFFLFTGLTLVTGLYLLQADGLRFSPRAGLLLLPILFLSSMTFFRQEPLTVFLLVAGTLFGLGVFAISYLGGHWLKFGLTDHLVGFLSLVGSMIVRPLGFMAEVKKEQAAVGEKRGPSVVWAVLRGVVIALPVIAIFASLLSSADAVFADRVQKLVELFRLENLPEYIFRLVYILIFAYAFAGTFLHAAQKSDWAPEEKPRFAPFLGFTEATIVLGSVVILFALFVAIQFQYFFGGQANINLEGYTYSEYARRGFGELVAVAFFSLLLLLGLGAITRRETDTQRRTFSTLGVVLVGLVLVMLVSAFQRLMLYENAYGFSRLRTYTHVFMLWLALLLVTVVALEFTRRERMAGLAMILALLGFAVSLSLLNVDAFIVNQNVQRELRTAGDDKTLTEGRVELDAQYFLDLSDDAVPALARAYENQALPTTVREKVGSALFCKRYFDTVDERVIPWQGFHFSRYTAAQVFSRLDSSLDKYELVDTSYPVTVKTPAGVEFYCYVYYD